MKKTKTEMKQEVKALFKLITDEKTAKLAIERMQEYNIDTDGLFDNTYYVTPEVLKACASDPKITYILKNPPEKVKSVSDEVISFDKQFEAWSVEERRQYSLAYIDSLFFRGKLKTDKNAGFRVFKIEDADRNHCSILTSERTDLEDEVVSYLGEVLVGMGQTASPPVLHEMFRYWQNYGVKVQGNKNEDGYEGGVRTCNSDLVDSDYWSLYRSPWLPDDTVPFPLLQETLNRMSEGPAFAAWIYGTYSGFYKGRQVFWIYGPDGEEGKSYLAKFLAAQFFGENKGYKAIDGVQIKQGSRFLNSTFVGAKLIVYPDCNRVHLMEMEIIKSLSSGGRDSTVSEEKFKGAQTITIEARVLVCSNFLPEVRRDNWYQSRLALCKITPLVGPKDPEIDKKYESELPGFLAYGKKCYEELCKDNERIILSREHNEWIESLIDKQDPLEKDIFARHFTLDKNGSITLKRVMQILELEENVKDDKSRKVWIDWLDTKVPGIERKKPHNKTTYYGMREITAPNKPEEKKQVVDIYAEMDLV